MAGVKLIREGRLEPEKVKATLRKARSGLGRCYACGAGEVSGETQMPNPL